MKESKEKLEERKIKKDHTMWFIILIGILVIMLACTFVYIWRLKNVNENNKYTETTVTNETDMQDENVIENTKANTEISTTTNKEQTNTKTCTYDNIKGTYEVNKKFSNKTDEPNTAYYSLYLYADGTYVYDYSVDAACGIMGNYMINGKEIILNKLFSHGSDVGVTKDKGQIKLTINDDGSIIDKNNLLEDNKLKNVKLQKKSSSISKDVQSLSNSVGGYISYLEEEAFK